MPEYIERESTVDALNRLCERVCQYSKAQRKVMCGACPLGDAFTVIEDNIPAADVRPVVLCKDCIYWQKPQVRLNDGTYRDYEPGEYENGSFFGGVTVDVGINIGSFCAKYNTEHQNCIPQFMGENDFCSKGYKLREES